MEVEISRDSLNCSRDWLVALVADYSHVCSPQQQGSPPKRVPAALFLSLRMPQLMRDNPSEETDETVKLKRRFDDWFQNDWLRPGGSGLTENR